MVNTLKIKLKPYLISSCCIPMAEESSTSPVYLDEDFYCPVCQEVMQTPVKTMTCEHIFCRKCFLTAMKTSGAHCPLCRSPVKKKEKYAPVRAKHIEAEMRKRSAHCNYCGKLIKYHAMRRHYKTCSQYQEEYGSSIDKDPLILFEDSAGNSNTTETDASQSDSLDSFQVNRTQPTFKCPLCSESNFDRRCLLEHCNNLHGFQIIPVACPICASMPWGDPNKLWRNVVEHLNRRHQFDYGEFVDFQHDEDTQYQNAVEESVSTYVWL